MQAKISYTVNFEEIPKEINNLLAGHLSLLSDCSKINLFCSKNNTEEVIEKIKKLRSSLLDVDTRLQECYAILTAYNKILVNGPDQSEEKQTDVIEQPISE